MGTFTCKGGMNLILALEHIGCGDSAYSVGVFLKEVADEEEAFYEMRRFLQINDIPSDVTFVKTVKEHEYVGRIIPKHKEVGMDKFGYVEYDTHLVKNPTFGIYYSQTTDYPKKSLGSLERWTLVEKKDLCDGKMRLYYEKGFNKSGEWYNCVRRYLDDVKMREGDDV